VCCIRLSQDGVPLTVLVNIFTSFNYTEFGDCTDPLDINLLHKDGLI